MTVLADTERAALLERAVNISLFTWRRAEPTDQLDDDNREGWWGDSFPALDNDRTGSRLWLLRRRKLDAQAVADAQQYAAEALQWLVDDGLAASVSALATRTEMDAMRLVVTLIDASGAQLRFTFDNIWQVIHAV
ncbi:phage GP46 family protein [Burkholderia vietnamiensis]|uniref:phage GP46 family protein n=1 Tax=Burkholderia vietnamiensis TaxID=60552 RepID=UPI000841D6CE|nr:phage GP46 family protein [Burkholderia vietnamiensis]AOK40845.1 hypothetical protein WL96_07200 [Burkholderia vietnamiensis]